MLPIGKQNCLLGAPPVAPGSALRIPRYLCSLSPDRPPGTCDLPWAPGHTMSPSQTLWSLRGPPGTWSPSTSGQPHPHQIFNNMQGHQCDINFFTFHSFYGDRSTVRFHEGTGWRVFEGFISSGFGGGPQRSHSGRKEIQETHWHEDGGDKKSEFPRGRVQR